MQVTPDQIEDYFQRYAWSYTRSSENTWITGVRTSVSSFRIFIRVSEHWIYFVINPFVVSPPSTDDYLRVYYHILRLNLDMNMAKFGIDGDGDIFLAVEMPTENFQYSHFSDALNGLSHHAERLYSEVFNLSHNSKLIEGRYDTELNARLQPPSDNDDDDHDADDGDDEGNTLTYQASDRPILPLDDIGLPEELINDSGEHGPIIAGKEVRIFDDEDGNARVEFQTAHDFDDKNNSDAKDSSDSSDSSDSPNDPSAADEQDQDQDDDL